MQVYANNVVFTLKIRLCLYKIAINYSLSRFFMLLFRLYKIIFLGFPIYNNLYEKYCQSYENDANQWNQKLYLK